MASVSASDRWLRIKTNLPREPLLTAIEGREGVSELFHFRLQLAMPNRGTIDFSSFLGRSATVTIDYPQAPTRHINGIINRLTQQHQDDHYTFYEAELIPIVWKTTKNVQSRIFQTQTASQILEKVFTDLPVRFELYETYHKHNYCVQYQESDFDFASRLMEEEGIFYYFEHSDSDHVMVVTDTSNLSERLLSKSPSVTYLHAGGEGVARREPWISEWTKCQELCPDHFEVWDYSFQLPEQDVGAREKLFAKVSAGKVDHNLSIEGEFRAEVHEHGGYAHRFDGVSPAGANQSSELESIFLQNRRTARVHMEVAAAASLTIEGKSDAAHFCPGRLFEMAGHFNGDGRYLMTQVRHHATMPLPLEGKAEGSDYRNEFTALPSALTYRPPRVTPRPKIAGTQSAVVVGPAGEEIYTDKYGRVKVRFQWDRFGSSDGEDSCWVRVSHAWSGQQWGMITIPRVGQEVLIAFAEGDPDVPMIVGSAYNAAKMPPFPLPEHRTRSCIKSHTQHGSPHEFHGLGFEDASGQEWLQLHSQKDMMVNAKNNHFTNVANVKHTYTGSTHITQVGNLAPISGSGSGGASSSFESTGSGVGGASVIDTGSGMGGESATDYYKSELEWGPESVDPTMGLKIETVYGVNVEAYLGLFSESVVGEWFEAIVNPLGYLGVFGGEEGGALLKGVAGGIGGGLDIVFGQATEMVYGPVVDIHRGPSIEMTNTWSTAPPVSKMLAGLYGGSVVLTTLMPGLIPNKTVDWVGVVSSTGVGGVAIAALTALETKAAIAEAAEESAERARALSDEITRVSTPIARGLAIAAEDSAKMSIRLVAQALAGTDGIAKDALAQATSATRNVAGDYTINAIGGNITLASKAGDEPGATIVGITSEGDGEEACNGLVLIGATGGVATWAGPASMGVMNEEQIGTVILDCGATGTIKLQSGDAMEPNLVMLDPEAGISCKSALKFLAQTVENSITIDPEEGITLSVGGATTLTMTPASLMLKCGEASIELSEAGVVISSAPGTVAVGSEGVSAIGPTLDLMGDGEVTISTAALMITEG